MLELSNQGCVCQPPHFLARVSAIPWLLGKGGFHIRGLKAKSQAALRSPKHFQKTCFSKAWPAKLMPPIPGFLGPGCSKALACKVGTMHSWMLWASIPPERPGSQPWTEDFYTRGLKAKSPADLGPGGQGWKRPGHFHREDLFLKPGIHRRSLDSSWANPWEVWAHTRPFF